MTFSKRHASQAINPAHNRNRLLHGDCLQLLRTLAPGSVDLVCTDPPYGIGFMGKEWDTFRPDRVAKDVAASKRKNGDDRGFANPALSAARYGHSLQGARRFRDWFYDVAVELLRVLKPGAFAFISIGARQDSVLAVIGALTDAGFKTDFTSLYWTYASGFPKALHIGRALGKRKGRAQTVLNKVKMLSGSYGGFQPKPAVEAIIVAMKPLSEKTYAAQALANGKGVTWLDDCRIPACGGRETQSVEAGGENLGRFPANLLVSDDMLNDGRSYKGTRTLVRHQNGLTLFGRGAGRHESVPGASDSGSYSRFFSLDAWAFKTLPFLIVSKAGKREKNLLVRKRRAGDLCQSVFCAADTGKRKISGNTHPTVKPLRLVAYLIALGSRPGDLVLDPFLGSGTTAVAAKLLGRRYIGIEREERYLAIARARLAGIGRLTRRSKIAGLRKPRTAESAQGGNAARNP